MAVLAPMPMASVRTAIAENPGTFASRRRIWCKRIAIDTGTRGESSVHSTFPVRSAPLRKLVLAIAFVSTMAAHARTTANVIPRTPDGRPDLEGFWDYGIATPLERPDEIIGRAF